MRTTFVHKKRGAFAVGEKHVKSIAEALSDAGQEINLEAKCADNAERKFSKVPEFLNYENQKSKGILSLSIYSSSPAGSKIRGGTSVDFETDAVDRGAIYIYVRSDDDEKGQALREKLVGIIQGTKPWYSWVTKIDWKTLNWTAISLLAVLLLGGGTYILLTEGLMAESLSNGGAPLVLQFTVLFFLYGAYLLVAGVIIWVRRIFFPSTLFLVGQEIERNKSMDQARWLVLGFSATLILSVIVAILIR